MSDNLFERLFELFQSPGPVNWKLAAEITGSIAGAAEPIEPDLAEEYQELGLAAQLLLDEHTPLDLSAQRHPDPIDRAGWAAENRESFRYLLEPLSGKLGGDLGGDLGGANPMGALMGSMGPAILGMQAGTMVGFMSHRVLGQFDTGVPALDTQKRYLVVPNVEAFAADHDLDQRSVRMWAAMHELANDAVWEVEWLRTHLVSAIDDFYEGVEFDPSRLMEQLSSFERPEDLEGTFDGPGGLSGLLGVKEQPEQADRVQAITAFAEGYIDYLVGVAAGEVLPDADRLDEAYNRRRAEPNQAEQFLQQLVGLSLERHRARDAALFCAEVARRWGSDALDEIWQHPDRLPTLSELTDPVGWAARVLL
jgi:putative hydrolase